MIIKYTKNSLHRPRLNHSRIGQALLDHTLRGNGSILVHILHLQFRLELLARKEYADITARLAASL